jgi:hypothetical protein
MSVRNEVESVEPVVILRLAPRQLAADELAGFEGKVVWSSDGVIGIQSAAEEHHRVAKLIASGLNEVIGAGVAPMTHE